MKYIKIASSLLFVGLLITSTTSCKYLKQKFAKNKEVVQDSFLMSLNEGSLDTSLLGTTTSDSKPADQTDASTSTSNVDATTSSSTSAASTTASSEEIVKPTASKPAIAIAQPAAKPATTGKVISSVPANAASTSSSQVASRSSTSNTSTSNTPTASTAGRRSTSIYDGINDQEERMIVRKAEGYIDVHYVDDYDGSNAEYEKRYKKASDLGSNYTPPSKKGTSTAWPTAPAAKSTAAKATPAEVDAATVAEPPKKATPTSRMGDKPKEEKPTSAEEMTKKKN